MKTDDPVLKSFLNAVDPRVILQADVPNFTIVAYNDAYKYATYIHYRDIIGWYLWEAFDPAQSGSTGARILLEALSKAVKNNESITMAAFRYDIRSNESNEMVECWWQVDILPVTGSSGRPSLLLLKINRLTGKQFVSV
jgi:hypothetical protein